MIIGDTYFQFQLVFKKLVVSLVMIVFIVVIFVMVIFLLTHCRNSKISFHMGLYIAAQLYSPSFPHQMLFKKVILKNSYAIHYFSVKNG